MRTRKAIRYGSGDCMCVLKTASFSCIVLFNEEHARNDSEIEIIYAHCRLIIMCILKHFVYLFMVLNVDRIRSWQWVRWVKEGVNELLTSI